MRRRSAGRRAGLVLLVLAAFTAVGTSALAYWMAPGTGTGQATTGTLNAPTNLDAIATPGSSTVNLAWDGSTLSTGTAAQGYYLTRTKDSDSSTAGACGSSAATLVTATTCADSAVPDGTFHYTVTAVYNSWTAASQSSTSITIDTTAPAAPTAPALTAASDSGSSSSDRITKVTTPTFTGTAEDGATVTLYDGATPVGTAVATGGAYSVTSSALTEGAKTMTVKATDVAGNVGPSSTSTIITIDTTAPDAPSAPTLTAASDSGASATDGITKVIVPTLTGTAEDGVTVTLYNGATPVGTGVAPGGAYSVTSSILTVGTKMMTVKATDVAGNVGLASPSTGITIDTTLPAAPSAPTLIAASDSGSSSSDRITNVTTPTFTGTAEDGATVTLYNGATPVGTAVATGGAYSVTSSALTAGTKTMTVKATDVAGNVGLSSPSTSITIDTTAPIKPGTPTLNPANDTGRLATDGITNVATHTVTGSATTGTVVTLYDGAAAIASTAATTSYSFTSITLAEGLHALTATAVDAAGNVSPVSTTKTVTIDTIAPAAPSAPDLSAASDLGTSSTDDITNDTTPTFNGPAGAAEAAATVTLIDGVTPVGTAVATGTGTYTLTSSTLTEGAKTMIVTATDVAGNVGPASAGTAITIDTTASAFAPSAPTLIVSSDTGISSIDGITKDRTPTFTGTAEDGVTVTLYRGVTPTGTAVTATGGVYTATTATLATGSHTLTAVASDVAGNAAPASSGTSVTIDFTAPTVTINQATGQADPTTASPIDFTVVFSESVYGLTSSDVTLTGTATPTTKTLTGADPTFNVAVSGMTKTGTVIANVAASKVTDAAGNNNVASTNTDSTVTYTDNTAPTVDISGFAPGALQSATASGTAGFGPGDSTTVTVVFCTSNVFPCLGGEIMATLTPSVNATTGAWSATSGTLGTNATLYAKATQTDLQGNIGQSLIAGPITIP